MTCTTDYTQHAVAVVHKGQTSNFRSVRPSNCVSALQTAAQDMHILSGTQRDHLGDQGTDGRAIKADVTVVFRALSRFVSVRAAQ